MNARMWCWNRWRDIRCGGADAADVDSLEGGRRATRELLSGDSGLTAIVCVNDLMAVGAMREIRERGLRIPEDISVTGFDNIKLAQFCYPALTTVHIPARPDRPEHLRRPATEREDQARTGDHNRPGACTAGFYGTGSEAVRPIASPGMRRYAAPSRVSYFARVGANAPSRDALSGPARTEGAYRAATVRERQAIIR